MINVASSSLFFFSMEGTFEKDLQ